MSRLTLQFSLNRETTSRSLNKEVTKQFRNLFVSKKSTILGQIRQLLVSSVANTDVFAGLQGAFPNDPDKDLQASFGLTSSQAASITQNMLSIIAGSVKDTIVGSEGNTLFIVEIKAIDDKFNEFLSLPGASFVSTPSNSVVPWMTWLLIDPFTSIDKAFGIVFQQGLSVSDLGRSRSGRALMRKLGVLLNSGQLVDIPYFVPALGRPQGPINFIADVVNSDKVKQRIINIFTTQLGLRRG